MWSEGTADCSGRQPALLTPDKAGTRQLAVGLTWPDSCRLAKLSGCLPVTVVFYSTWVTLPDGLGCEEDPLIVLGLAEGAAGVGAGRHPGAEYYVTVKTIFTGVRATHFYLAVNLDFTGTKIRNRLEQC